MNIYVIYLLSILIGYCFGCFHSAYFLGRVFFKKDIREYGSKSSGTTNALRVFGWKVAIPVLVLDFLKSYLPVFFASQILQFLHIIQVSNYGKEALEIFGLFIAAGVVLGHNFPIYLKFQGGKGIASTIGIMFAIDFRYGVIIAVTMITLIVLTRYVSLASVTTAVMIPFMFYVFDYEIKPKFWFGIFLMASALYKHRANIKRLMNGTENKIGEKTEGTK